MANLPFLDFVPMLICGDVQASIRFYPRMLGFEVTGRLDDVGATGFASLGNGKAAVMPASPAHIPRGKKVDGCCPQSNYHFTSATPKICADRS